MTPTGVDSLRLAVLQTDAVLEDIEGNATAIAEAASGLSADLVVTPELSLTGYSLGASAGALARGLAVGSGIAGAEALGEVQGTIVVGLPERSATGHPFNAAAAVRDGRVRHVHRKRYLPTYGMFEEARHFTPGQSLELHSVDDAWSVGLLICEDLWHPALAYLLAMAGADIIAILAAAPGRGVWDGGDGSRFGSWEGWIRLARVTAQVHGTYVALANRGGVEGPVTFAGGSLIVAPDGAVVAQADASSGVVLEATLDRRALDAARAAAPHRRDEDARWLAERLRRLADG
ncbi:MAG TPA: nitrilase-related carbon-nitrogen hydrolase [Longimicrobiales bacterium]|nr:nitrilase-related carbon-nitrogen hydrolase [Longimicrobiales bacterium]